MTFCRGLGFCAFWGLGLFVQLRAQAARDRIDVLVVVDNHGQSDTVQKKLSLGAAQFFAPIEALDYHIGVISADQSQESAHWDSNLSTSAYAGFPNRGASTLLSRTGQARFFEKQESPYSASLFLDRLTFGLQSDSQAMGLASAFEAVQTRMFGDSAWNHGFIRSDALLSVLIVSDEDEHLNATQPELLRNDNAAFRERIETLVDYMSDLKPCGCAPPRLDVVVRLSEHPVACENLDTASSLGTAYAEAARRLSGRSLELCDPDLNAELGELGQDIAKAAHEAH
jgi:hypothetical protein